MFSKSVTSNVFQQHKISLLDWEKLFWITWFKKSINVLGIEQKCQRHQIDKVFYSEDTN